MAKTMEPPTHNIDFKDDTLGELIKAPKIEDDYSLFVCDRCKRQCTLLTKETHKPAFCPFLKFETNNAPYIFKF